MDERDWVIGKLEAYKGATSWEERTRESMLALAEQRPNCFLRNCLPGHFTASVYISNPERTKILLMKHKKTGFWLQCGGHADGQSNLFEVATRELEEESGLPLSAFRIEPEIFDVDMHVFPLNRNTRPDDVNMPHIHFDVRFRGVLEEDVMLPGNEESEALRWFGIDEALALYPHEGNRRPVLKLGRRSLEEGLPKLPKAS